MQYTAEVTLFFVCLAKVFFRAWQQRNVTGLHYKWIDVTSFFMTVSEVYIWGTIAYTTLEFLESGVWSDILKLIAIMTVGNSLGCRLAMFLHHRYVSNDRHT